MSQQIIIIDNQSAKDVKKYAQTKSQTLGMSSNSGSGSMSLYVPSKYRRMDTGFAHELSPEGPYSSWQKCLW